MNVRGKLANAGRNPGITSPQVAKTQIAAAARRAYLRPRKFSRNLANNPNPPVIRNMIARMIGI
jgi:hypothetical protein